MPEAKKSSIPELAAIEIRSTTALKNYIDASRSLARDFAGELEWAAEDITAILTATGKGNPFLMGIDTKIRARRIAKYARRAAELQRGTAVEMVKLWQNFLIQFEPALAQRPKDKKPTFEFKE